MRASFLAALGGLPARTPLQARTTGAILLDEGIRVEKVLFASQPNFWVSGNVYVPRADAGFRAPYPALLVPCGHTDNGKAAASYQYAGIAGARAGFLTLVYDPVDQGERVESPDRMSWRGHNWGGALADRLGMYYLNLNAGITDEQGQMKAAYTIEGMHMYGDGYMQVLEALMPVLKTL